MTILHKLAEAGQSIWLDYIRRSFLTSGELSSLIKEGLRGITSNPTIFEKAVIGSADYDEELQQLMSRDASVHEIYQALIIEDIRQAADLLRPVYDSTNGVDGMVSLEVDPTLAYDTKGTIEEARLLFKELDRPNVMIKVPATAAGIPAIETLIGEGINVNVTLIFSVGHYLAAAWAYLRGLQKRVSSGQDVTRIASVASLFISRIDTAVDKELEARGMTSLLSKIAIANAKMAYQAYGELYRGPQWESLKAAGARPQRLLWGSTSVKNPVCPDTLYVDGLIGPDTVNTLPPATLKAFLDHGAVAQTLTAGLDEAREQLRQIEEAGIDLNIVCEQVQREGVDLFAQSFTKLMNGIGEKRTRIFFKKRSMEVKFGDYQEKVDVAIRELEDKKIISRLWAHDHTVWKPDPAEITNRLGWLTVVDAMTVNVAHLKAFTDQLREEGFTNALLLGMGGSSLAPEVFSRVFGTGKGYISLSVLDSTHPEAVLSLARTLDPKKTLYIVSTKSGGTVETLSFFSYFYTLAAEFLGPEAAGSHFAAITDPGSSLADLAAKYHFRKVFLNDPAIGGRYSALSYFGLAPASLLGMNVESLLDRAAVMVRNCESCNPSTDGDNSGAFLGAAIGELALRGRDKLTLVTSPALAYFGLWLEQLIAESTGKEGTGIVPVTGEHLLPPEGYGNDRVFVYLRLEKDATFDGAVVALSEAGHPVIQFTLQDPYDLGAEFFRWEVAVAVAGWRLGINPFDQPNVEAAKKLARKMTDAYKKEGTLPVPKPALVADGMKVYGELAASTIRDGLLEFLAPAGKDEFGAYVAIQAYLNPGEETDRALQELRTAVQKKYRVATTVGYGPRFLHSTGQLHKGDSGKGLFLQFMADSSRDAPIPDAPGQKGSSMTFGVLIRAQALGDREALIDGGRKILLIDLGSDAVRGLKLLRDFLAK